MESYGLDPESAILGAQILNALSLARITYDDRRLSKGSLGSVALGVHVTGDDKPFINAILSALAAAGVAVSPDPPLPST
jgi:hypothetical protein